MNFNVLERSITLWQDNIRRDLINRTGETGINVGRDRRFGSISVLFVGEFAFIGTTRASPRMKRGGVGFVVVVGRNYATPRRNSLRERWRQRKRLCSSRWRAPRRKRSIVIIIIIFIAIIKRNRARRRGIKHALNVLGALGALHRVGSSV